MKRAVLVRPPWLLLATVAALAAVGLTFLRSSTLDTVRAALVDRQAAALAVGLAVAFGLAATPLRPLAHTAGALYLGAMLLLALVLVAGTEINHARRWFLLPGGVSLQPSEVAKVALIVMLARYLEFRPPPRRLVQLLVPVILTLVPFLLVRAEPDLGTALMFLPIAAGILLAAGARWKHFLLGLLLCAGVAMAAYHSPLLQEYQKERVRTFLTSVPARVQEIEEARRQGNLEAAQRLERDLQLLKRHSGYQSHAAQVAIGSGGWRGKGLGEGPQNRLNYLPERHSDFVFAVVGEEWGFLGSLTLLLLYLLLSLAILQVGLARRDLFGRLVCAGVMSSLVGQALANMAMCSGLLPITGMPLPFLSQGGTALVSCLAQVGLVLSVARSRASQDPFLYRTASHRDPFGARRVHVVASARSGIWSS